MKIRLYRGPFNGKVLDHAQGGRNEISVRGPKPMTRKQKYEWEVEQHRNFYYNSAYSRAIGIEPYPMVTANYRISMRVVSTGGGSFVSTPLYHPDGSLFYEWDKK